MKQIVVICIFLISCVAGSQNNALFDQGKEHYKNSQYQEAINSWEKIISNGDHSADLYFNLANANYKLNRIGPSIYYYEKALQLSANDSDIKNNLAFAQNARIDAIEPLPRTIFNKWYNAVAGVFSFNGWAILTVIFSLLFALLFLSYWFSAGETKKRLFFSSSLLSLIVFFVGIAFAYLTYNDALNNRSAIVFSESVEVHSEPSLGSDTAFDLHEGTKIKILAQEDKWIKVKLSNGKEGWMPESDVKEL